VADLGCVLHRLEKYVTKARKQIFNFYSTRLLIEYASIQEFHSLIRYTIMSTVAVRLFKMLIKEQTLSRVLGRMTSADWKQ
jgi:hypothetical protein